MKHGDVLQRRRRNYKAVEAGFFWDWYYEYLPNGDRRLREKKVPRYDWVPDGWTYYGLTFRYRYDPVPGVKHWRNSFRDYFKHPQTTQERRKWYASEGYGRGKRSPRYLPHTWDDIRYARRHKGWKRTKKKRQWMKKGDKLYEKNHFEWAEAEGWMLLVD